MSRLKWVMGWAALAAATLASAQNPPSAAPTARTVVGWVSDGHCGAKHMKTGGKACVRKCIAGAEHLNPEWKPGGMVFVTADKKLWKVDNPDALWGHESEELQILAVLNAEGPSLRVEKVVRVLQE